VPPFVYALCIGTIHTHSTPSAKSTCETFVKPRLIRLLALAEDLRSRCGYCLNKLETKAPSKSFFEEGSQNEGRPFLMYTFDNFSEGCLGGICSRCVMNIRMLNALVLNVGH